MIESGNVLRHAHVKDRCYAGIAHAIQPDAQYVENVDSAPGYHSGDRYCLPCARAFAGYEGGCHAQG